MNPSLRPSFGSKNPAYLWFPKDFATDDCRALNMEEQGVYRALLDHTWVNQGVPSDEVYLESLFKNAFGLSRYKFRKIWPRLKIFFTESEGRYYSPRLEDQRAAEDRYRAKQKKNGEKANVIRWSRQRELPLEPAPTDPEKPPESIPSGRQWGASGDPLSSPVPVPASTETEEKTSTTTTSPPSPPKPSPSSQSPPGQAALRAPGEAKPLTDQEYQTFVEHCATVVCPAYTRGLPVPGRELAAKLRAKFPDQPVESCVKFFPKYVGQRSAAYWLTIPSENLQLEALRQQAERESIAPHKPTAAEEQHRRLVAWAREKDRREGQG